MSSTTRLGRLAAVLLAVAFVLTPGLAAQSTGEAAFYRAYYLEHEEGRTEAAFELYREAANDVALSKEVRQDARRRAEGLAEDLASSDFARLVPHDTIFYAELSRPGEQLESLLAQLGILGRVDGSGPNAFGISPLLVESALGMRGAAVAVTNVELQGGMPNGVLILHPGDLDLVRGMIETALPAGGVPVAAIDGYPTWHVEGQVYVTMTSRLLVASPDPAQIEAVLGRLRGDDADSLADNPNVKNALAARGDGLLTFCLNAEPILPMVQWVVQQQTQGNQEAAMALGFVDLDSLRCISGHIGVDDAGLDLEIALELAQGHRNLVFNLMRQQPVGPETLQMVPEGAAFFLAGAYNPAGPMAPIMKDSAGQPVVTFMDFGRELFGNLVDVAVYGMPLEGEDGGPIPDVAAVIRSNDAERTQAVLGLLFDMATQGSTGGRMQSEATRIAGVEAIQYNLGGVPVYVATEGDRLIVSPSRGAVAQSVAAAKGQGSVLHDPMYANALHELADGTTFVMMANAGRCASMAAPLLPPSEAAQMQPYLGMLQDSVFAMDVEQSETRLAFRAQMLGIPDIGPVVAQALRARREGASFAAMEVSAPREEIAMTAQAEDARRAAEAEMARRLDAVEQEAQAALEPKTTTTAGVAKEPSLAELQGKFDALAAKNGGTEKAHAVGRALVKMAATDPMALNNFAWALLTEERYGHRFDALALDAARRANQLSKYENWIYLDTLAHAVFFEGNVAQAIDLEHKAIELAGDDSRRGEAEAALKRFQAAAAKSAPEPEPEAAVEAAVEAQVEAVVQEITEEVEEQIPTAAAVDAPSALRKFEAQVARGADQKKLEALGRHVLEAGARDAGFLNDFAWGLLTEERYGHRFDDLALDVSMRSNKLTKFSDWLHVDTLAHAVFFSGDVEGAIDLETKAIELARTDPRVGEAEAALQRFVAAREKASGDAPEEAPVEIPDSEPTPPPAEPAPAEEEPAPEESVVTVVEIPDAGALRREFDALVKDDASHHDVMACGRKVCAAAEEDADFLNAFAWGLLTEEVYGNEFDELALDAALCANRLSRFQNWFYVDTLALAVFQSGDVEGAIGLEQTAIELAGDDERRGEAESALARFEAVLAEQAGTR